MTGFRDWATQVFGPEYGNDLADRYADAVGRSLDAAVFHGTQPIQENDMSPEQITEVSATVDAGLTQDDLDGMNEAERLALVVGAAYGKALAERDEARAQVAQAVAHLDAVLATQPATSFAHTNAAADQAREFVQRIRTPEAVDSEQTPTGKD